LLLLYKTDLKENSAVILESVNREGKTNWSLQDALFAGIGKAFSSEDLGCEYTFSDNLLIINLNREETQYVAVDINTGKILWSFNPKEYLAKSAS
jgi:outer membrane protein assembly factor BamB